MRFVDSAEMLHRRLAMRRLSHYDTGHPISPPEAPMALSPEQMNRKLDEHFGYECRDDVDGVLATLAPDVVHDIVGAPTGPTSGRESARGFYEQLFADLADGSVQSLRRLHGQNFIVDESLWRG